MEEKDIGVINMVLSVFFVVKKYLNNMKDTLRQKLEKGIEKVLCAGFGATAIAVSMNEGKITDGIVSIRDKSIEDVKKISIKSHRTMLLELKEKVEKMKEKYKHNDTCPHGKWWKCDCGLENIPDIYNTALTDIITLLDSKIKELE